MTANQEYANEGPIDENSTCNGDDIIELIPTEQVQKEQLVKIWFYSFKSKSMSLKLNHKYQNKWIDSIPFDASLDEIDIKGTCNALERNHVTTDDIPKLEDMLISNSRRITNHYAQQVLVQTSAGQRAKKERTETLKNGSPIDVTIDQALKMHEGNVRIKGMISTGSDRIEKMITRVYFRCGVCDHYNSLIDYMEKYLRPVFTYELPQFNLKDRVCIHGCKSLEHELREEVINAYRIELQEAETFNDLSRLPIILFEDCIGKVVLGEQVITTGSIQRIKIKGRLLTYVFTGLNTKSTIEYEHKKESDNLADEEIKEFQEFGKSTKNVKDILTGKEKVVNAVIDGLVSKFCPSIINLEHVKKGMILCAANSGKDTYHRKLRINALLIGPPG